MLHLDNVSVSYLDTLVLRNISIKIKSGEKIAIIGPSGAGKTTLLQALFELEQEHSAFVHQNYALVPQLSVFHNVYIGRLDFKSTLINLLNLVKPQKNEIEKILPILEGVGIADFMNKRVGSLSGGQQQRTAIARAMYRQGKILFADEPVSSIDQHQAGKIMALITEMTQTVVLSMHDVNLALEFTDRIIGLRSGKIVFDLHSSEVDDLRLADLYTSC